MNLCDDDLTIVTTYDSEGEVVFPVKLVNSQPSTNLTTYSTVSQVCVRSNH